MAWVVWCVWIAVWVIVGWNLGKPKGLEVAGALLGLVLGPLGALLVAVSPANKKRLERRKPPEPDRKRVGFG